MGFVKKLASVLEEANDFLLEHFNAGEGWHFEAVSFRPDGVWFDLYDNRGLLAGVHNLSYEELGEL